MVLSSLSETSSIWTHRRCSCPDRHSPAKSYPVRKSDCSRDTKEATSSDQSDLNRSGTVGQDIVQWLSEIQKRTIADATHLHSDRARIPVSCDHTLSVTPGGGRDVPHPHAAYSELGTFLRNVKYVGYRVQTERRTCLPSPLSPFFAEKQAADYQWVIVGLFLFLLEDSRIFPAETEIHLHYILENFTELDL